MLPENLRSLGQEKKLNGGILVNFKFSEIIDI